MSKAHSRAQDAERFIADLVSEWAKDAAMRGITPRLVEDGGMPRLVFEIAPTVGSSRHRDAVPNMQAAINRWCQIQTPEPPRRERILAGYAREIEQRRTTYEQIAALESARVSQTLIRFRDNPEAFDSLWGEGLRVLRVWSYEQKPAENLLTVALQRMREAGDLPFESNPIDAERVKWTLNNHRSRQKRQK